MKRPPSPRFIALFALLAVTACDGANAKPDQAAKAPEKSARPARVTRVETAVVNPSTTDLVISLPGEVEASRDANLAASLGGFIEKVNVESGDAVRKGQVLALVDTASHQVRRYQTKVELDTANRELRRAKKLGDALPGAQLDAAQARVDAAKAAYRAADVQVARSVISAPFSGVVAMCDAEVGEVAPPGAPLIRVVKLDPMKVSVSLSDRDVLAVKKGMAASVTTDARATVLEGVVAQVRPAADINTRAFTAEVELDNADDTLRPGMIATVQIQADSAGEQIVIPQDWLVTKPKQLGVFVNEGNVARWRTVKAGTVVRDQVVILSGLKTGERIIIKGHRELADGDQLLVTRTGRCCQDGRAVFDSAVAAPQPPEAPAPEAPAPEAPAPKTPKAPAPKTDR